jgi:hypothetical protein
VTLRQDISDGLHLRPLRAWWRSLWPSRKVRLSDPSRSGRRGPIRAELWDQSERLERLDEFRWLRDLGASDNELRSRMPLDPICASCKRRGWHWEEYETGGGGTMRRKATCLGTGEYFEPPPPRDPRNRFFR